MIQGLRLRLPLLLLLLLIAAAGFGGLSQHRLPQAADLRLEAWLLSGSDMADLCGEGAGPADHGLMAPDCPLCRLVAVAVLPGPGGGVALAGLRIGAQVAAPQESRAPWRVRDPAFGLLRGPPLA